MVDIAALLLTAAVGATALHAERYAGEFLNIPVGAKAYGMGGAFGPVADDASAIFWNPAGLAQIARPQVMVTHTALFGGLAAHDYLGLVVPGLAPRLALGVAWIRFAVDDIPRFSHTVGTPPQGSFGDNENAIFLTAASARKVHVVRQAIDVGFGGSVKAIYDKLDDRQATGLGLDLGLLLRHQPRHDGTLCLSLIADDIGGTAISWNTVRRTKDVRSPTYRIGTAYTQRIDRLRLAATLSFETASDALLRNRFGAELAYRRLLSFRAGNDGQGATVGAGLSFWRLTLDYGFNKHELGNSHRVSASFRL
jgi:hypothetical protein